MKKSDQISLNQHPTLGLRAHWCSFQEEHAWMALFEAAFGHAMARDVWYWKYRDTQHSIGIGVWKAETLIAFYGGMPRDILYFGLPEKAIQIGDVMVHPSARGVLTKNGPFQFAASTFLAHQIGFNTPHLLGFGFPNARAFKLAKRLKLYEAVDHLMELSWKPTVHYGFKCQYFYEPVTTESFQEINALWAKMALNLKNSIVGVRDALFIQARYLNHPHQPYSVLMIRRRFSKTPIGVMVLKHHLETQQIELIDLVGPFKSLPIIIQAARQFAKTQHAQQVFSWITQSHHTVFNSTQPNITPMDVVIPTNIWNAGPSPEQLTGKWWLMAGDSDFR